MATDPQRSQQQVPLAALQLLYALDSEGGPWPAEEELELALQQHVELLREAGAEAEVLAAARALATHVAEQRQRIDEALQRASANWRLERMNRVDRNLMRLAAGQMLQNPGGSSAHIIDQTVELAKQMAAPKSPSFINGVLNQVKDLLK